jgi:Ca-activated chloride channel family protein
MSPPREPGPRPGSVRKVIAVGLGLFLPASLVGCGGRNSASGTKIGGGAPTAAVAADGRKADFDKLQQEQYAHVVENPFQAVAAAPLSTFSADVNTASYSNVRRFLNEGSLPPKDAVLIAGLVRQARRHAQDVRDDKVAGK